MPSSSSSPAAARWRRPEPSRSSRMTTRPRSRTPVSAMTCSRCGGAAPALGHHLQLPTERVSRAVRVHVRCVWSRRVQDRPAAQDAGRQGGSRAHRRRPAAGGQRRPIRWLTSICSAWGHSQAVQGVGCVLRDPVADAGERDQLVRACCVALGHASAVLPERPVVVRPDVHRRDGGARGHPCPFERLRGVPVQRPAEVLRFAHVLDDMVDVDSGVGAGQGAELRGSVGQERVLVSRPGEVERVGRPGLLVRVDRQGLREGGGVWDRACGRASGRRLRVPRRRRRPVVTDHVDRRQVEFLQQAEDVADEVFA